MHVYGLTGGIGSGKSSVAQMLETYGIPVVSADELSRMVVAKGSESLDAVREAFGAEVLDESGELDRQAMARIVFSDADKRKQLESILHPRIRDRFAQVLDALEKSGHEVVVYEVPLLFEKKLQADMHAVVLVTASTDTRVQRVIARDSSTREQVMARMNTQMPEGEKRKLSDYVIDNEGDEDDLRREVEILISRFLKIAPATELKINPAAAPPAPKPATPAPTQLAGEIQSPAPSRVDTVISTAPEPDSKSPSPQVGPDPASAVPTQIPGVVTGLTPPPPSSGSSAGLLPPPPKTKS